MVGFDYKYPSFENLRKALWNSWTQFKIRLNITDNVVGASDKPKIVIIPDDPACIEPYLFLGSAYGSRDIKTLDFYQITHLLNVADEIPSDMLEVRFNIKKIRALDLEGYDIREHFEEAFNFIEDAKCAGGRCLIFCKNGNSRAPTFVIAYLMYKQKLSLEEAYEFVLERRPSIAPNPSFMLQLQFFEEDILENKPLPKPFCN